MPHSPGGGAIDSRLTGRQRKTQTWSISASVFLSKNVEFTFVLCYSMQQKHLGMDRDEILRLKQITGLAALFKEVQFGKAWQPDEEDTEDIPEDND